MNINNKRILAISISRAGGSGYLETALPSIKELPGDTALNIAFIPFALVDNNNEKYTQMVLVGLKSLPYNISIVIPANAINILEKADAILVGGGTIILLTLAWV